MWQLYTHTVDGKAWVAEISEADTQPSYHLHSNGCIKLCGTENFFSVRLVHGNNISPIHMTLEPDSFEDEEEKGWVARIYCDQRFLCTVTVGVTPRVQTKYQVEEAVEAIVCVFMKRGIHMLTIAEFERYYGQEIMP